MENYEIRARRDRDGHGGGLIEFAKRCIICKRVKQFETAFQSQSVQKLLLPEWNGFVWASIGHPTLIIYTRSFKEVSDSLSKASLNYESFIIMGDFNIDINTAGIEVDKIDEFAIFLT